MIIVKPNTACAAAITATERENASARRAAKPPQQVGGDERAARLEPQADDPSGHGPGPNDAEMAPQAGAPPSERPR